MGLLDHVPDRSVRDALDQPFYGALNRLVDVGIHLPAHPLHFFGHRRLNGPLDGLL
jgi:hypothetical protein